MLAAGDLKPALRPSGTVLKGNKRHANSEKPNSGATPSSSPVPLSDKDVRRKSKFRRVCLNKDVAASIPRHKGDKDDSTMPQHIQNTLESMTIELEKIQDKYRLEKNRNQRLKRQNDKLIDQYNETNRRNEELEEELRLYRRSRLDAERERIGKITEENTTCYYTLFSSLP
jgi:hypothetical protein